MTNSETKTENSKTELFERIKQTIANECSEEAIQATQREYDEKLKQIIETRFKSEILQIVGREIRANLFEVIAANHFEEKRSESINKAGEKETEILIDKLSEETKTECLKIAQKEVSEDFEMGIEKAIQRRYRWKLGQVVRGEVLKIINEQLRNENNIYFLSKIDPEYSKIIKEEVEQTIESDDFDVLCFVRHEIEIDELPF